MANEIDEIFKKKKSRVKDNTIKQPSEQAAECETVITNIGKRPANAATKKIVKKNKKSNLSANAPKRLCDEDDSMFDSRGTKKSSTLLFYSHISLMLIERKMEDGTALYAAEDLKIGLGGGTADCPFDCQCCF